MPIELIAVAGLGALAGVFIGCVGIGGVIIVPALVYIGGYSFDTAIAAAMMGYIPAGLMGAIVYSYNKSINWSMAGWLCAGAMPAAVAGAWISNNVPAVVLATLIGLLTLSSGGNALVDRKQVSTKPREFGAGLLVPIGGVTGVLSAMTGTGGPLVLVPTMLWLQAPVLTAIGLSQAVQLPLAALATLGNFMFGEPDVPLGIALGLGLACGVFAGGQLAHKLPGDILKKIVAVVLICIGLLVIVRGVYQAL